MRTEMFIDSSRWSRHNAEILHIVPFLQPITDIYTGRTVGAEILCRVKSGKELVLNQLHLEELESPERADFYAASLLVRTGELLHMGGLAKNSLMHRLPDNFFFSLNIMTGQIGSPLIRQATQEFRKYFVDKITVVLEIVERNIDTPERDIVDAIALYSNIGVRFAIDDGCANAASMQYFGLNNVTTLKLDRAITQFHNDILIYHRLISGMLGLADMCGLQVIAEGVDNVPQKEALADIGIKLMQGFLFSKAISIPEFCKLMLAELKVK